MSRLRVRLVLEEVSDTNPARVLTEKSYGAFVGEKKITQADVGAIAGIVYNTVKQELPKFWKLAK